VTERALIISSDGHDVEAALAEIRWAAEAGFKGVLLPTFTAEQPLFHPRYEPVWSLLEELDLPLNSHVAISGSQPRTRYSGIPDPAVSIPLHSREMLFRSQ
jgi:predicted TIM-barrel fold metal-dependent hydrolase